MSKTPSPIVWDFYRSAGTVSETGGVIEYNDEVAQSITMTSNGMVSSMTDVSEGQWEDAEWVTSKVLSSALYTSLRLDHPSNGEWYGSATLETRQTPTVTTSELYLLRYSYEMNLTDNIVTGTLDSHVDNPINQLNFQMQNTSENLISDDSSLFQIGARLELYFGLGNAKQQRMCTAYIDSIDCSVASPTISISARNTIGYFLSGQTMDETKTLTGNAKQTAEYVLNRMGVTDYAVQNIGEASDVSFSVSPNNTGLSVLKQLESTFSSMYATSWIYAMEETAYGKIIIGYDNYRYTYSPKNRYKFKDDDEVFTRKISKSVDGVFYQVYATGTDADGEELTPVTARVDNTDTWDILPHKTYFAQKLEGVDAVTLDRYAKNLALSMRFNGTTQTFLSPFRPQLVVGDAASVYSVNPDVYKDIGIVTAVKHNFGINGFTTEFSIDSGGLISEHDGILTTRSLSVNGNGRRKKMIDFVMR